MEKNRRSSALHGLLTHSNYYYPYRNETSEGNQGSLFIQRKSLTLFSEAFNIWLQLIVLGILH